MQVLTDQGPSFESHKFQEMCNLYRIAKRRTTPYHPEGNGACERFNRTLKEALRRVTDASKADDRLSWDRELKRILFVYNTTPHSATGETPFVLQFGTEARFPAELVQGIPDDSASANHYRFAQYKRLSELYQGVREHDDSYQRNMKDSYDVGASKRCFAPGDLVRVKLRNLHFKPGSKLAAPWSEPFEVTRVKGVDVFLRHKETGATRVEHFDHLSKIASAPGRPCSREQPLDGSEKRPTESFPSLVKEGEDDNVQHQLSDATLTKNSDIQLGGPINPKGLPAGVPLRRSDRIRKPNIDPNFEYDT